MTDWEKNWLFTYETISLMLENKSLLCIYRYMTNRFIYISIFFEKIYQQDECYNLQFLKLWQLKLLIQEDGVVMNIFFSIKISRNINISLMQQYVTYFFLQKILKVLCQ